MQDWRAPLSPVRARPRKIDLVEIAKEHHTASHKENQGICSSNDIATLVTSPNRIISLPPANLSGDASFYQTLPLAAVQPPPSASIPSDRQHQGRRGFFRHPATRAIFGLLTGALLLWLLTRLVDIPATLHTLRQNIATTRGLLLILLSSLAFLLAYFTRSMRWKIFLNPVGKVSAVKVMQLFLVGNFINFVMPVQGGEVAKGLMLKRISGIALSQSLPTIAMGKVLDLMPALCIIAIVPLTGLTMDIKLWFVLILDSAIFVAIGFFVILAFFKRSLALSLLHKMAALLPGSIGNKLEGFATGFIDALLMITSRPGIFFPALFLTCLAVCFDGLYAMLSFWAIGFPVSFLTALFGYTIFSLFSILPNPPGQVGSNEMISLLVFTGLLHLPADKVTAMVLFYHPWSALLMCSAGIACLSSLGLTISTAMNVGRRETDPAPI